jgi:gliding motility-associated-like protein
VSKSNDVNCTLGIATLTATGAVRYTWTDGVSVIDRTASRISVAPAATTVYTVWGTGSNGCVSEDSIQVNVAKGGLNGLVPDAFTPNNDGKNDCFGVKTWGYSKDFKFSVFNRWGVLMFETTDPNRCWDGTYKGVQQKSDTYVYQINATTLCGSVSQKGTVVLIR